MLALEIRRAPIEAEGIGNWDKFVTEVPDRYRALLRPARELQAEVLGSEESALFPTETLPRQPLYAPRVQRVHRAEVFTDRRVLLMVSIQWSEDYELVERPEGIVERRARRGETWLLLHSVGSSFPIAGVEDFSVLLERVFGVQLVKHSFSSDRFRSLMSEGMEAATLPSTSDLQAANVLADAPTRTLARAIKSAGGLLVKDAPKQLSRDEASRTDEILESLRAKSILDTEIVVVCTKTQAQTARAPSREALDVMASGGLRCACGKSVSDENVEEAVTLTETGRELLDGSRWLSLVLLDELSRVGISPDQVALEQQAGGDEIDCLADLSGELVLFELKDKEFNLGEAYSFGAKIGIIRPDYPVILTTHTVGNDAKEHFQRAELAGGRSTNRVYFEEEEEPRTVRYIEGLAHLRLGIEELVSEVHARDAGRILSEILPLVTPSAGSILSAISGRPTPRVKRRSRPKKS